MACNFQRGPGPDDLDAADDAGMPLRYPGTGPGVSGNGILDMAPSSCQPEGDLMSFSGIPYSLDMPPCPLIDGTDIIENEVNRETLAGHITERAVRFIDTHHRSPFFLYFPHRGRETAISEVRRDKPACCRE